MLTVKRWVELLWHGVQIEVEIDCPEELPEGDPIERELAKETLIEIVEKERRARNGNNE